MRALLEKIRQQPETHKKGVALGLSLALTLVISLGWAGQRGWLNNGEVAQAPKANQITSNTLALSPIQSSKKSLASGLSGLEGLYEAVKNSVASVFVPFITGIEVYERK